MDNPKIEVHVDDGSTTCHACGSHRSGMGVVHIHTIPKLPDSFMYWLLEKAGEEFLNQKVDSSAIKNFCQVEIEYAMIGDRLWFDRFRDEWVYWSPI